MTESLNTGSGNILIRKYNSLLSSDREAVRKLAVDTADIGNPAESIWDYREPVADILTGYYTKYEPESIFVAESDGEIIGYIMGSVRTKSHYDLYSNFIIIPSAILKAIFQGALFDRQSWRLLCTGLCSFQMEMLITPKMMDEYPAHIHVNIKQGHRGANLGQRLISTYENYIRESGIKGVHARVRGDNERGRRFFERVGFVQILESKPLKLHYRDGHSTIFTLVTYGKRL
jgi:ribosomal protein S18 acetylase RimI-like enzyme